MVSKFIFGNPIKTNAVINDIKENKNHSEIEYLQLATSENFISLTYNMSQNDIVYGLGENIRGINKRGYIYESYCNDDPMHTEDKRSLYGAHNFLVVSNDSKVFGLFIDSPSRVTFDVGFTNDEILNIYTNEPDFVLYIFKGENELEIVKTFREMIGRSYIPPLWAFGYQQSKWSYHNKDAVLNVYENYRKNNIPIDAIYLDIDYMQDFKDFTINEQAFPNFEEFVSEMKSKGIHLVPIIDAGVKIEDGYDVYEEGVKNNYFVKDKDGNDYVTAVWPGKTLFPDFLNSKASKWFGDKYKILLDMGIDGFWNDMNEPAIFYSENGINKAWADIEKYKNVPLDVNTFFTVRDIFPRTANSIDDYKAMYHNMDGTIVNHDKVHNLYGYMMTKSASDTFESYTDNRILLFSRASYIGMHRYGGIWQGDNQSWWSHLELNIKMMSSINMCGFLYTGADLGGFGSHATKDLVLRWTAFSLFTPIMRNHSALGTRNQECYSFDDSSAFKSIVSLRYRLIPYLYSEYLKSAINNDMMFKPLSFEYKNDDRVKTIEDQLLVGESIMIAPVYKQNQKGRYVYLPENMLMVRFKNENEYETTPMKQGDYYIEIPLNEVVIFIRKNKILPLCEVAENTEKLNRDALQVIGYIDIGVIYELYDDDGISKNYNSNKTVIKAQKLLNNVTVEVDKDKNITSYDIQCF